VTIYDLGSENGTWIRLGIFKILIYSLHFFMDTKLIEEGKRGILA